MDCVSSGSRPVAILGIVGRTLNSLHWLLLMYKVLTKVDLLHYVLYQ